MIRSFRPVGQGNFTVEIFDKAKLVFDCGSIPQNNVISEIDSVFQKDDVIDILYLSHLDYDHCSGVDHLISRCNVKKIVIPYLDNQAKLLTKLRLFIEYQEQTQLQFLNLVLSNGIQNGVVNVFEKNIEITYIETFEIDSSISLSYISKNGYTISSEWINWIIIPFNFKDSQRTNEFQIEISKDPLLSSLTVDNLAQHWPLLKDKLINIYESKITGDINTNSMVVYSGPKSKNYYSNFYYSPGALFTGDYNTSGGSKRKALLNAIKDYILNIGFVTVPHHGSENSNDKLFLEKFNSTFVIQSGTTNPHNHPHYKVLLLLGSLRKHTVIINENSPSFDVDILII